MRLSEHFTLEELTRTDTGIENLPGLLAVERLLFLANFILEPARRKFGKIHINSGYRATAVNEKVGGSETSQHVEGGAADIVPLNIDIHEVYMWMRDNLSYGQLILEEKGGAKWIHVSLPRVGKKNMMAGFFGGHEYLWTEEGV
jgi:hypothetical protein